MKQFSIFTDERFEFEVFESGFPTSKLKRIQKYVKTKLKPSQLRMILAYCNQLEPIHKRMKEIRDMPPTKMKAWGMYKLLGIHDLTEQVLLEEQHLKLRGVLLAVTDSISEKGSK